MRGGRRGGCEGCTNWSDLASDERRGGGVGGVGQGGGQGGGEMGVGTREQCGSNKACTGCGSNKACAGEAWGGGPGRRARGGRWGGHQRAVWEQQGVHWFHLLGSLKT